MTKKEFEQKVRVLRETGDTTQVKKIKLTIYWQF